MPELPELPPGALWAECGPNVHRVSWGRLQLATVDGATRRAAASAAWVAWADASSVTEADFIDLLHRASLCDVISAEIANAIDRERERASLEAEANWIGRDPKRAFVDGLFRAYAIASNWINRGEV